MAPRSLVSAVFASLVAACTSIGPGTVPHDRIDYGTSIGNSWKEQTLLNIVKLRYADMPIFLEIAQPGRAVPIVLHLPSLRIAAQSAQVSPSNHYPWC